MFLLFCLRPSGFGLRISRNLVASPRTAGFHPAPADTRPASPHRQGDASSASAGGPNPPATPAPLLLPPPPRRYTASFSSPSGRCLVSFGGSSKPTCSTRVLPGKTGQFSSACPHTVTT